MKKWFLVLCLLVVVPFGVSAHGGNSSSASQNPANVEVLVNGVSLESVLNNGKTYVSVNDFSGLFGKKADMNQSKNTASLNGKQFSIKKWNGVDYAWIRDLADAVNATQVTWDPQEKSVYVLVLPEGTIQLDPVVVPAMGEHWANPVDMPTGPIYGVYEGKLVFIEYMISQQDFADGSSFENLEGMKGLPSPAIVQSDIGFVPNGHPGFEIPHYDLHFYFISDEEQQQIK